MMRAHPEERSDVAVDAQAQKLLDMMAEQGGPPLSSMTPQEARALPAILASLTGPGPDVHAVRDIEIPGPAGGIPARVYEPVADPAGTVVYYHGGGWVIGGLDEWDAAVRILAVESGARVVSVDYRLAPEHPFPAAADDAFAAAQWAAAELAGGGPIVVAGDSAGGNLAAVVSRKARDADGPQIALQVLIYPVVDSDLTTEHYAQYADTHFILNTPDMQWFWDHYVPNEADRTHPDAAPLRAESLEGLPPAFLLVAGNDPLFAEGLAYGARLEESGVTVQTVRYDDQIHAFFTLPNLIEAGNAAIAEAGAAIKAAL
jgi:acetyl esterase